MTYLTRLTFLLGIAFLSIYELPWVLASDNLCTVCKENASLPNPPNPNKEVHHEKGDIHNQEDPKILACASQHLIHGQCLNEQIESTANIQDLENKGLKCCAHNCPNRYSLETIKAALSPEARSALETRLAKAKSPTDPTETAFEIKRLVTGLDEAFNLSCPVDGCGGTLDQLEGCNAATCSNEDCQTTFCYLCLKPQDNPKAAHDHVKEHSGDFWERRPGYKNRYHWLIARQKLAYLFERKVDKIIRQTALEARKTLLLEQNMWPMPAGIMSKRWIEELNSASYEKEKTVEILQNEFIFRHSINDTKNASLIKQEVFRLGHKIILSLDLADNHGIHPKIDNTHLIPVLQNDPRVSSSFSALGAMYQVGDIIWSGVVKAKGSGQTIAADMTQPQAKKFCEKLGDGAKLPTTEDYKKLATALGAPDHYDPKLLPDYKNWFWTEDIDPTNPKKAHDFFGVDGSFTYHLLDNPWAVRCVFYER